MTGPTFLLMQIHSIQSKSPDQNLWLLSLCDRPVTRRPDLAFTAAQYAQAILFCSTFIHSGNESHSPSAPLPLMTMKPPSRNRNFTCKILLPCNQEKQSRHTDSFQDNGPKNKKCTENPNFVLYFSFFFFPVVLRDFAARCYGCCAL